MSVVRSRWLWLIAILIITFVFSACDDNAVSTLTKTPTFIITTPSTPEPTATPDPTPTSTSPSAENPEPTPTPDPTPTSTSPSAENPQPTPTPDPEYYTQHMTVDGVNIRAGRDVSREALTAASEGIRTFVLSARRDVVECLASGSAHVAIYPEVKGIADLPEVDFDSNSIAGGVYMHNVGTAVVSDRHVSGIPLVLYHEMAHLIHYQCVEEEVEAIWPSLVASAQAAGLRVTFWHEEFAGRVAGYLAWVWGEPGYARFGLELRRDRPGALEALQAILPAASAPGPAPVPTPVWPDEPHLRFGAVRRDGGVPHLVLPELEEHVYRVSIWPRAPEPPGAKVTVTISAPGGFVSVSPTTLEFSDHIRAQHIRVTITDWSFADFAFVELTHTASGGGYDGASATLRVYRVE